jgi:hypothetical protein
VAESANEHPQWILERVVVEGFGGEKWRDVQSGFRDSLCLAMEHKILRSKQVTAPPASSRHNHLHTAHEAQPSYNDAFDAFLSA